MRPSSRSRRTPAVQVTVGEMEGVHPFGQECRIHLGRVVGDARVEVAVPLPNPWKDLAQPAQQRGQPFGGQPSSCSRDAISCERLCLLLVVPAGPAEQQGRVTVAAGPGYDTNRSFGTSSLPRLRPVRWSSGSRLRCTSAAPAMCLRNSRLSLRPSRHPPHAAASTPPPSRPAWPGRCPCSAAPAGTARARRRPGRRGAARSWPGA